jgi:hypothetical protein
VKILVLINCSYKSPQSCWRLSLEWLTYSEHVVQSLLDTHLFGADIGVQIIVVFYLGMSTLHERLNHFLSWHLKLGEIKTHSFIHSFHVFQLPANETCAKRLRGSCISYTLQFASQSQVPSLFRCVLTNKEHVMLLWKTRSTTHLWCEISKIFNRSP